MRYEHLTEDEREVISQMLFAGAALRRIAQALARAPSTISRERRRNGLAGNYRSHRAQDRAAKRRRNAKRSTWWHHAPLLEYVLDRLKQTWSPEQIAGRLRVDFPDDPRMRVSHETVYRFVRQDKRQWGTLHTHLRQASKKRRKRYASTEKRGQIPNRVWIDERPKIVEQRGRFGDWESDTVEGRGKKAYIATHVERKSRFTIAAKLPNKKAATLNRRTARAFNNIPAHLRKTFTVDNGKEFAAFKELQKILGIIVYFAHPYHSWERGLNENTNGLLREFFPKKKDLRTISQKHLDKATQILNNRPRKRLGYRTPKEVFSVALQI